MKSLNNYINESLRVSSTDEYITESKSWSSDKLAEEFAKMTIDDNDQETIEDDIEIFLDKLGDILYDKGGDALYKRLQKGILNITNKWSKY